ncbi:Sulfhydryl oxidase, partial [Monkeypox virus]
YAIDVSKVKPL